jgi:hypothetical protein
MKKITINSKDYKIKNVDFNAICELEDLGLSISDLKKRSLSTIRALVAFYGEMDIDTAGQEIMEHLKKGGSMKDFAPLIDSLVDSDFFQAMRQSSEKTENAESESKA